MARAKKTIARDSVFRIAQPSSEPDAQTDENPTRQTAVHLYEDDFTWLDDQILKIKRSGWRGANRSALLRALIEAARQADIDLAGVEDEWELAERLTQ